MDDDDGNGLANDYILDDIDNHFFGISSYLGNVLVVRVVQNRTISFDNASAFPEPMDRY